MPFGNPLGYLMPQMQQPRTPDEEFAEFIRRQQAMGQPQPIRGNLFNDMTGPQPGPGSLRQNAPVDLRGPQPDPGSLIMPASSERMPMSQAMHQFGMQTADRSDLRGDLARRNIEELMGRAEPGAGGAEAKRYAQQRIQESGRFNAAPRGINPFSGAPSPASLGRHLAAGPGPSGPAPTANPLAGMSFEEWAAAKASGVDPNPNANMSSIRGLSADHPSRVARAERNATMAENRRNFYNTRNSMVADAGEGGAGAMGSLLSPQALSFIPPQDRARYVAGIASVIGESQQRSLDRVQQLEVIKQESQARGDLMKSQQAHEAQVAEAERAQKLELFKQEMALQMEELQGQREQNASMLGLREREVSAQEKQSEFAMSPEGRRERIAMGAVGTVEDPVGFANQVVPGGLGGSAPPPPKVPEGGFVNPAGEADLDAVEQYILQADPLSIYPGTIPRDQLIALREKYANAPGFDIYNSQIARDIAGLVPGGESARRYMGGEGNSERERYLSMLAKIDQMLQVMDLRSGL